MGDTYTQLYIQLVFAVKGRNNFIQFGWQQELYKYIIPIINILYFNLRFALFHYEYFINTIGITAVEQNDNHKMLSINGMPDHIHIFLSLNPVIAISDLVKDIKRASNNWINYKGFY